MLKRKYKIDLNKANFRQLEAYKVQFAGLGSFYLKINGIYLLISPSENRSCLLVEPIHQIAHWSGSLVPGQLHVK